MATSIGVASRNLALDAALDVLTNGYLRIYSGTPPADADTALAGNVLLAELRFGATPFAAASSGAKNANAITSDTSADASGTATFARAFKSDGTTVVLQCSVGTTGADVNLDSVNINAGDTVNVSAMSITFPS